MSTSIRRAPSAPSTPLTETEKLAGWKNHILSVKSPAIYEASVELNNEGIKAFWFSGQTRADFATMQKRFEAMGADIAPCFRDHGTFAAAAMTIASANGINPVTGATADPLVKYKPILLPTFAWVDNADGTKTPIEEAYALPA